MTTEPIFHRKSESESIVDADIDGLGKPVVLVFTGWNQAEIVGPDWRCACPKGINTDSIVRMLDAERLLVADRFGRHSPNAHVISRDGSLVASFDAGVCIQDIVVCGARIVVSYSDQGIFGNDPLSWEGVVVFNHDGSLEFGYKTQFGDEAVDIADCYALYPDNAQVVWFVPYPRFPLVQLELPGRRQDVLGMPGPFHESHAMCATDDAFFFHSNYKEDASILAWSRRGGLVEKVGEWKSRLRGILGGRFLGVTENEVVMLTPRLAGAVRLPSGAGMTSTTSRGPL